MIPLYIPTKGRWDTATTPALLGSYPYILVVEKQEERNYREIFPSTEILVLPESNQGIAYARNYINQQESEWYWMLDDDLTGLYRKGVTGKYKKADGSILHEMEKYLNNQIAQMGLVLPRWKVSQDLSWNKTCGCIVCNHAGKLREIGVSYRQGVPVDTDMTLQILTSGYRTLRLSNYAFTIPPHGSNKGGLYEVY